MLEHSLDPGQEDFRRRPKLEGGVSFKLHADFSPAGDQPTAIKELVDGIAAGERDQVLLGATGTGKTFTMAKIIEKPNALRSSLPPTKPLQPSLR